jgi:diaminohydroxyphosphoribosylaminopyrimidine deaminase/5-amino-6-(5-phosphoribosylamino)uracil reductase
MGADQGQKGQEKGQEKEEEEVVATDLQWMRKALSQARKGWGRTSPNPLVGAVIVKNDTLIASGYHAAAGQAHAEIAALRSSQNDVGGATIYVTLEPCSTEGRTPPCTDALIAAGLSRIVIGCLDPNPEHAGRGVEILRSKGIAVEVGVEEKAAQELNEAFNCWIRYRRPFVLLKMAMTIDGRIATAAGQSQWITGTTSRARVQKLRQWADAVLVGGETVRRDDPSLLVRTPQSWSHQPLRLIASRSGELGDSRQVLTDGRSETRIIDCADAAAWQQTLVGLGEEGITALLVEGGGELAASMLAADVIDKIAFFIAPTILGGKGSRPVVGGDDPPDLLAGRKLRDACMQRSGEDFLLTGYLSDVHRTC